MAPKRAAPAARRAKTAPRQPSTVGRAAARHLSMAAAEVASCGSATNAGGSDSRALRRRAGGPAPQDAPDWQRVLLEKVPLRATQAAARRSQRSVAKAAGTTTATAAPAKGRRVSAAAAASKRPRGRAAVAKKSSRRAAGAGQASASSASDTASDSDSPSTSTCSTSSSSASSAESDSSDESGMAALGGAGKGRRRATPSRASAASVPGSPTSRSGGRRLRKAELQCPLCRLQMDEWPYCGLTGEAHRLPE